MNVDFVKVSCYETNCYILTKDNFVLVIDPGDDFDRIKPFLNGKNILGCVITHGHDDHNSMAYNFDNVYDFNNLGEGKNAIGPFEFEVIYTPGHTKDSITLYFANDGLMFTGDFLFKGTIGRTDLDFGNDNDMMESLAKIYNYPNVVVYPGHGDFTTLGYEKENNVYFLNL